MLTTTMNFPTRRAPSPQIRARDTPNDGTANGSAGVNSAPDVDAGVNAAPHLGGQCCGDHDDRGESTNYRKLAEHVKSPSGTPFPRLSVQTPGKYSHTRQGRTERVCQGCYIVEPARIDVGCWENFAKSIFRVPYWQLRERQGCSTRHHMALRVARGRLWLDWDGLGDNI